MQTNYRKINIFIVLLLVGVLCFSASFFCFADDVVDLRTITPSSVYVSYDSKATWTSCAKQGDIFWVYASGDYFNVSFMVLFPNYISTSYFDSMLTYKNISGSTGTIKEWNVELITSYTSPTSYSSYIIDDAWRSANSQIVGDEYDYWQFTLTNEDEIQYLYGYVINIIGEPTLTPLIRSGTNNLAIKSCQYYNWSAFTADIYEYYSIDDYGDILNGIKLNDYENCFTLMNAIFTRLQNIVYFQKLIAWGVYIGIFGIISGIIATIVRTRK